MKKPKKDPIREDRIHNEAIVDAYGAEERAMGWYYYLENPVHKPVGGMPLLFPGLQTGHGPGAPVTLGASGGETIFAAMHACRKLTLQQRSGSKTAAERYRAHSGSADGIDIGRILTGLDDHLCAS